jgi:pilus assembly protein CpaE
MKLPVVLIGENGTALTALRQKLATELAPELDLLVDDKVHGLEAALEVLRAKAGPVLALVDLSQDAEEAFLIAQEVKSTLPNIHLLMTSSDNGPQTILQAMRSGAEEFLLQPYDWPEVRQSLDAIRRKVTTKLAGNGAGGRVITIFANKGGVGSTTVATHLGVALAGKRQKSVCLADLASQFGSVTSFLNLEASYTISDLAKNLKRMDALLLEGALVRHSSGLRVLAEPLRVEDGAEIRASDIEQILAALVHTSDFVIVDSPKELNEISFLALERAHLILFVTEMSVPSLKSASGALELFDRAGIDGRKVRLVVNRYIKNRLMGLDSVEKTVGIKVFRTLPDDYPRAMAALNQGLPLFETDPASEIAKGHLEMADAVVGLLSDPARQNSVNRKRPGIFSRWIPVRRAS